jgi:hypothetical protein
VIVPLLGTAADPCIGLAGTLLPLQPRCLQAKLPDASRPNGPLKIDTGRGECASASHFETLLPQICCGGRDATQGGPRP